MNHATHTETAFEEAIEAGLLATGRYEKRPPSEYDAKRALFPADVLGFLKETQPVKWDALEKLLAGRVEVTILDSLGKELALKGSLHVLRHGFRCYGKTFRLAYFRPNSGMNREAAARYESNRLTITRQIAFESVLKRSDGKPRRCIIDVVLAVNGLPVVTAELKNPLTGQHARDAIKQYQTERDGRDLLFVFKQRALVHFAVDPDEVWMTTRLRGRETTFLPFNRGARPRRGQPARRGQLEDALPMGRGPRGGQPARYPPAVHAPGSNRKEGHHRERGADDPS